MQLAHWDIKGLVDFLADALRFRILVFTFAKEALEGDNFAFERLGTDGEFVVHAQAFHGPVECTFVFCGFEAIIDEGVDGKNYTGSQVR